MAENNEMNVLDAKAQVEQMIKNPKDAKQVLEAGEVAVKTGQISNISSADEKGIASSLPAKEETKQIGR